jgi:hypothetical protein
MTVEQAATILSQTEVRVAVHQRFAFDSGTLLRLDNYAIINIFDDGRYYLQGENTEALIKVFSEVEAPWDPESWSGEVPRRPAGPPPGYPKRFEM